MSLDADALRGAVARHGAVIRVVVAEVRGSAPREPGAAMTVRADGFEGTVGGGALEHAALAEARRRLAGPPEAASGAVSYALGPALAQCCGGAATLAFERWDAARLAALEALDGPVFARPLGPPAAEASEPPLAIRRALRDARGGDPTAPTFAPGRPPWLAEPLAPVPTPLWIWGAGHVGRAVVRAFEGLPFAPVWLDDAPGRFPDPVPPHVAPLVAAHLPDACARAPAGAAHLVMTYSHALDLEICHRLLARGDFARLGLIGSASKAARFRARLRALGHAEAALDRLQCPIGLVGPDGPLGGKTPAEIAVCVAADHVARRAAGAGLPRAREAGA